MEQGDKGEQLEKREKREKRDRELEQMLGTLDSDLQIELLESIDHETSVEPPELGLVERIEQKTFAKLNLLSPTEYPIPAREVLARPDDLAAESTWWSSTRTAPTARTTPTLPTLRIGTRPGFRKPVFRWRPLAVGGVAAVAVIGLLTVTPGPVSAAFRRLIEFIPGIGTVQQSEGTSELLILTHSVAGKWFDAPVTITGLMVSPTQILVRLNGMGFQAPKQVSFETTAGKIMALNSSQAVASAGSNGAQWSGDYSLSGNFGQVGNMLSGTVIIGPNPMTRIPVQLQIAKGVTDLSKLGPTDTHQGIAIALVATPEGQKINLTFVSQYKGPYTIWNFAPVITSAHLGLQIQDSSGKTYSPTQIMGVGPNNQFTFHPTPGVTDYRVVIPQVEATYQGDARVTLPIPLQGSMEIHKTVNLGGFPISFTKVERINDSNLHPGLRFYFDLHASPTAAKELQYFDIGMSNSGKVDTQTGALEYLQIAVDPNQRSITLHLTNPQVYLRGPWTFDVHIPGSKK